MDMYAEGWADKTKEVVDWLRAQGLDELADGVAEGCPPDWPIELDETAKVVKFWGSAQALYNWSKEKWCEVGGPLDVAIVARHGTSGALTHDNLVSVQGWQVFLNGARLDHDPNWTEVIGDK
jgi:hypothetical protein